MFFLIRSVFLLFYLPVTPESVIWFVFLFLNRIQQFLKQLNTFDLTDILTLSTKAITSPLSHQIAEIALCVGRFRSDHMGLFCGRMDPCMVKFWTTIDISV